MEFKDIVKTKREELGLNLQDIADYIGVSVSTIQRYEKGEITNVRRDKIYKLSKILKVTPGYLMGWEESDKKYNENNKLANEVKIIELIKAQYGNRSVEIIESFTQLDEIDQIRIMERIDTMLEDEKYSIKKESLNA